MGFDILNVSSYGLENINFKIEDYENGILNFDCEEILINSVSTPILIVFEKPDRLDIRSNVQ